MLEQPYDYSSRFASDKAFLSFMGSFDRGVLASLSAMYW